MIWIDPDECTLGGVSLSPVREVTLSQRAENVLVSYGDAGPHPGFVDASRIRSTFVVRRDVVQAGEHVAQVGDRVSLAVGGGASLLPSERLRVSCLVVVTKNEWRAGTGSAFVNTIECVGYASVAGADPVTITREEVV